MFRNAHPGISRSCWFLLQTGCNFDAAYAVSASNGWQRASAGRRRPGQLTAVRTLEVSMVAFLFPPANAITSTQKPKQPKATLCLELLQLDDCSMRADTANKKWLVVCGDLNGFLPFFVRSAWRVPPTPNPMVLSPKRASPGSTTMTLGGAALNRKIELGACPSSHVKEGSTWS